MSRIQLQISPKQDPQPPLSRRLILYSSAALIVGSAVVLYLYYRQKQKRIAIHPPPSRTEAAIAMPLSDINAESIYRRPSDYSGHEKPSELLTLQPNDQGDELFPSQSTLRIKQAMTEMLHSPHTPEPGDIQSVIAQQYANTTDSDPGADDESSLDSDEKWEIVRAKTFSRADSIPKPIQRPRHKVTQSNLFRPSDMQWDADRIDEEHNAMLAQLAGMADVADRHLSSGDEINTATASDLALTTEDDEAEGVPFQFAKSLPVRKKPKAKGPGMFRIKSAYKWDSEQVDQQTKEMQDQLAHLVQNELATGSTGSMLPLQE